MPSGSDALTGRANLKLTAPLDESRPSHRALRFTPRTGVVRGSHRVLAAESTAARVTLHPDDTAVASGDVRFPTRRPSMPQRCRRRVSRTCGRGRLAWRRAGESRFLRPRVYEAGRPELFLKDADGRRTVARRVHWRPDRPNVDGAGAGTGTVVNAEGSFVAYTVGNDVTARDVEAQNPLYLLSAKVFTCSCSLGSVAVLADDTDTERVFTLRRGHSVEVAVDGMGTLCRRRRRVPTESR